MQKIKTILQMIAIIISLMGITTFSSFILEETFQTIMFGSWPAQDAKDWRLAKIGADLQEKTIFWMKFVNYGFGWIQPLGFIAYANYARSAEFYVDGLRAKIFAHCPECFNDEEVEFIFRPQRIENGIGISGTLHVTYTSEHPPGLDPVVIRGMVRAEGDRVRVQASWVGSVSSQK